MYGTKSCTIEDFGNDDEGRELLQSWNGYTLFCPQIPEGKRLVLKNKQGASQNLNMLFGVEMCTSDCPSDLNEFIKEVTIDYWAV